MPRAGLFRVGFHVIVRPEEVEHVLGKNFENYIKGPEAHDILGEFLGNGIFSVDGQEWYHQRKIASRMFTRSQFQGCLVLFSHHGFSADA